MPFILLLIKSAFRYSFVFGLSCGYFVYIYYFCSNVSTKSQIFLQVSIVQNFSKFSFSDLRVFVLSQKAFQNIETQKLSLGTSEMTRWVRSWLLRRWLSGQLSFKICFSVIVYSFAVVWKKNDLQRKRHYWEGGFVGVGSLLEGLCHCGGSSEVFCLSFTERYSLLVVSKM